MPKVTVTLNKPHTHAGKRYDVGDQLILERHDAEFLFANKVIGVIPSGNASAAELIESEEAEVLNNGE